MAKNESIKILTGPCFARYVRLDEEETYEGAGTGKISCPVVFEGKSLEDMSKSIADFIADTFPPKKAAEVVSPFKTAKDGTLFIKFQTYLFAKDKVTKKPVPVYDAKGKPVKNPPKIGNGSKLILRGSIEAYEHKGKDKVRCWLSSVQIVKLNEFQEGGGFAPVDDEDAYDPDEFAADSVAPAEDGDPGHSGESVDF